MNVAIIPARGGSKGVPKKNIKELDGLPLIAYSIRHALESKLVDRVIVSTDCIEIKAISEKYGAEVVIRPENISGDLATTEQALIHTVKELNKKGEEPELVVLLQCTSPIRDKNDIDNCIELVLNKGFDSALSVVCNHKFIWRTDQNGSAKPLNYDPNDRKMRQQITEYQENGSIYVMKTDELMKNHCRLNGKIGVHVMDEKTSYEIDTFIDFTIIEQLLREN